MTYAATAAWLRPRLWVGLVVGLVPWAAWIGSLASGGWYKDSKGTLIGADHLAFYTAAHLIRNNEARRMYDYDVMVEYQRQLIGWDWKDCFEAYRNPPFYALLYVPSAGFSFYASMLIWMVLSFALLAFAIWLAQAQQPVRAFLWSLAFYPVFAAISFGQNTFLSLAVFAGVYRLLVNGRCFSSGMVAGLLWFKPQLLLGLFLWWLMAPRRFARCWLGVALTGAILAAIGWILLPEASEAFVRNLPSIAGFHGYALWNAETPRDFFKLLLPDQTPINAPVLVSGIEFSARTLVIGLCAFVVSAVSIAMAWRLFRRNGANINALFPVAVFLSLWVSPHALVYEWTLLIPACVVLWEQYPRQRDAWLCLFALAWFGLTVSTALAYLQLETLRLPWAVQVAVPLLGIAGWLAARELLGAGSNRDHCRANDAQPV